MAVKIIYPGGRAEFLDPPVLASEIMAQNPKCWVTLPEVFQQPWAVLPPDTNLSPGHKFYVVPKSTVRKLRRHFLRSFHDHPTASSNPTPTDSAPASNHRKRGRVRGAICLSLNTLRRPFHCLVRSSRGEADRVPHGSSNRKRRATAGSKETPRGSASPARRSGAGASPGTPTSYNWQPSLKSISEEL